MKPILLIDFGSTYTKLTAVDPGAPRILGRAQAFTTAATDISEGLGHALEKLEGACGKLDFSVKLACSSAAGGLNMVVCGLVPSLTSKAARLAAFTAGAKVIKTYAYQLTNADLDEITRSKPDILLLTGGTDGGNSEVILGNARALAKAGGNFPVVVAGNRSAQDECADILGRDGRAVYRAPNVMPEMNRLDIAPVQQILREVFLRNIIRAKGLSRAGAILDDILMPTPSAVLDALTLLSEGTKKTKGLGELVAVDLGGATTDVYSIAKGHPSNPNVLLRGLPEPYAKRTVEGDIGMRYNARGILEAAGAERLAEQAGSPPEAVGEAVDRLRDNPARLPQTPEEESLDRALATCAMGVALGRHAGSLTRVYTAVGPVDEQTGKDLTRVGKLVVTGGALVYSDALGDIVRDAIAMQEPVSLTPRRLACAADRGYILSAMGLFLRVDREAAMQLLSQYLGKDEFDAAV